VSPAAARVTVPAAVQAQHRFDGFQFARAADEALVVVNSTTWFGMAQSVLSAFA
jgi:hypothetical protein